MMLVLFVYICSMCEWIYGVGGHVLSCWIIAKCCLCCMNHYLWEGNVRNVNLLLYNVALWMPIIQRAYHNERDIDNCTPKVEASFQTVSIMRGLRWDLLSKSALVALISFENIHIWGAPIYARLWLGVMPCWRPIFCYLKLLHIKVDASASTFVCAMKKAITN